MICKNCSAEYDDKCDACPECKTEKDADCENLNSDDSLQEADNSTESDEDESVGTEECEKEDVQEASDDADEENGVQADGASEEAEKAEEGEEPSEEANEKADEATAENDDKKQSEKATVKSDKAKAQRKIMRRPVSAVTKKEKRISAFIIVLMCFVGVLAVAFSVINITTDIFESDDTAEKMVASVGFVPQEAKELEKVLAKCFSAAKKEYSRESTDAESFLERINPADKGNVYSRVNNVTEALQTEADPAGRFVDENGEYAYYKLEESRVDAVLELFGLESYHCENTKTYYYCDGYYYFAAQETKATPVVLAEITKSRRVLDGSYYAECYFYIEKNGETVKTDICNFVIEMTKDEQTGECFFAIKRISLKPIFGSDGKLLDSAKGGERKSEIVEGKTDSGKLFCRYIIDYPVLEGDGAGYKNVNDFFKNAISVYELNAKSAQKSYDEFIAKGGTDELLPFEETAVAEIVFEDDKNISFIGKLSRFTPVVKSEAQQQEVEAEAEFKMYERTVEAYTIDKASGNFVSKDSVLGKDYMMLAELLYRIYNDYEYADLLPEPEEEGVTGQTDSYYDDGYVYDDIPADTEKLGTKIYESAWALTDSGVTFYYVTEKGYVEEVIIPNDVVKALAE